MTNHLSRRWLFLPLIFMSLMVSACQPTSGQPAADGEAPAEAISTAGTGALGETTSTLALDDQATPTLVITETAEPTATEVPENIMRVGDLELVPFAPAWFDGDLATAVFVENGLLRIDEPIAPYEPGTNQVMGAVTLASFVNFDIAATFNAEGGVCTGVDYSCGNISAINCIVFDFVDFENMQSFCIDTSALFWNLVAFENGVVTYGSSVQPSDAIHDTGVIYHFEHPIPNEIRLTLRDGVLTGYINGDQVFERDGRGVEGKVGAGCVNEDMEEEFSNCEVTLVYNP